MAEIINLNKARKARDKAEAKVRAANNRAEHGVPKADRDRADAERDRRNHELDGARIQHREEDEPA
jgi:hypothetical protein